VLINLRPAKMQLRKIKPHILFLTNKFDLTVDYLIHQVKSYRIDYLRINSEDINDISITIEMKGNTNVRIADSLFDLGELKSVYFRRSPSLFPATKNSEDEAFVNRERRHFFEGMLLTFDCFWINPMYSTHIAERKLFQLKIANQLGFLTPNTLISNDSNIIKSFIDRNSSCIIKPISYGLQKRGESFYSMYTSDLQPHSIPNNVIFESPALIQSKIFNYRDIRATVVGRNIFSASIIKKSKEVDWRRPDIEKIFEKHSLPADLENKIHLLNSFLNLNYSAIDFILDNEGNYIFLEINPVGEWAWLEKELEFPISGKLLEMLIQGHQ